MYVITRVPLAAEQGNYWNSCLAESDNSSGEIMGMRNPAPCKLLDLHFFKKICISLKKPAAKKLGYTDDYD